MAVGDTYVFPGFLTPALTLLFFPKPPTTFLTCFCRGERRKYAGKKSCLNQGSNSQPPGHESDTLTTEPPERAHMSLEKVGLMHLPKISTLVRLCSLQKFTWTEMFYYSQFSVCPITSLLYDQCGCSNKRAMMALDCSPESFSPQLNSTSLFLWFQLVTLRVGPVLTPKESHELD